MIAEEWLCWPSLVSERSIVLRKAICSCRESNECDIYQLRQEKLNKTPSHQRHKEWLNLHDFIPARSFRLFPLLQMHLYIFFLKIDRHQSSNVKKWLFSPLFWKKYTSKNDRKKQQKNNCTISFLKPVFFLYIRYKTNLILHLTILHFGKK